jgi:RecA-family ATPase
MTIHPAFESQTAKAEAALRARNDGTAVEEPPGFYAPIGEPAPADAPKRRMAPAPLKIIRPEEWRGRAIPPRKFVAPGMVPYGVVTGLYGPPGKGKSTLAMQLQAAAASGGEWCGRAVEPIKSVGVYCEDDEDELMRRWQRIEDHMQIGEDDSRNARMVSRLGDDNILATFTKSGIIELTPLHKQVIDFAKDEHAELVILDTVSDCFAGNENDRPQVRQFVQVALGTIAREIAGAVMFLAHPSRAGMADGSGQSGSTAWEGTVRSRLYFHDEDAPSGGSLDRDARVMKIAKANYAPSGIEIPMRYSNGVFVPDLPAGNPYRAPVDDVFMTLLDAVSHDGRRVSHMPRAANYAPREFARSPQRQGYREPDFEAAMNRLFAAKSIRVEEFGPPSRRYQQIVKA